MALIALEFEDDQIFVASARTSGKRVQIQHLFSVAIEGSDEEVANTLKSELSSKGLSRSDVIVVVSRGNAEVRLLEVPPAPDNELPDIVKFVARNEFASLNDNWLLDFVRLTGDQASTGQVLAAGVSPEMSNQVKTIVDTAGLRLRHMVLRPFAAVDFVRDRIDPNTIHLLVDPNNGQTDLTIVDGTKVIATRTVRVPSDSDHTDQLVPEIRRTIASSSRALGGRSINQVIVFGSSDQNQTIGEKLRTRLDTDVTLVDPLKHSVVNSRLSSEHPTRYVALMGSLIQHSSQQKPAVDFLNPRRVTRQSGDYSKWWMYGSIAAAALLLLGAFGWWTLRSQSLEITQLKQDLMDIQRKNNGDTGRPSVKQTLAEVGKIDDWVNADVNWHEQIFDYSQLALTADDTIVDSFTATAPSSRTEGKITVIARSKDYATEKALIDELSNEFEVNPSRSDDIVEDKDYPIQSTFNIFFEQPTDRIEAIDKLAGELVAKQNAQRQEEAKKRQQGNGEPATDQNDDDKPSESTGKP
ncbi:MAG: hypothetical protein AAFN77_10835 [Planctomycetota bacterium]